MDQRDRELHALLVAVRERDQSLAATLAEAEAQLVANPGLPRLFLLEEEYRCAVVSAELGWVRGVVEDLRAGRLAWTAEWLRELAAANPPTPEEIDG